MELMIPPGRLDRPVDHETDHVLGPTDAEITLVEYGSYACPHCRTANERIAQARDQLGDSVCYAFRHRPLTDNSLSFRAAELAELAQTPEAFWSAHIKLMTRSMQLTEDDLVAVAADIGVNADFALGDSDAMRRAPFHNAGLKPGAHLVEITAAPPAPAHSGSGAHHHTGSANPDGRRLVEDDFAAATAAFLNELSLDGTIEHLVVVSDPRTLGEMRKHFHRDVQS